MKGMVEQAVHRGTGIIIEDRPCHKCQQDRTLHPTQQGCMVYVHPPGNPKTYTFTLYDCIKNGTNSGKLQPGRDVWFAARKDGTCGWVSAVPLTPEQEKQLKHLVDPT